MSKLYSDCYGRSHWSTEKKEVVGKNHTTAQTPREAGLSLRSLIPGRMLKILISVLCCAVLFTVGILIGHYAIPKSSTSPPSWVTEVAKDLDESFIDAFISEVNNIQIQENLRWVGEDLVVFCLTFIHSSTSTGSWRRCLTWPPQPEMRRRWNTCWRGGRILNRAWTRLGGRNTWSTCLSQIPRNPTRSQWVSQGAVTRVTANLFNLSWSISFQMIAWWDLNVWHWPVTQNVSFQWMCLVISCTLSERERRTTLWTKMIQMWFSPTLHTRLLEWQR